LLVSCGLRISEALRLQEKEVHLTDEVPHIVIRETKFKKSRIVPLHPTVAERLSAYASRRDRHCHARHSAVFFVTDSGRSLDLKYMERWFSRVIDRLDLRTSSGRRPTLHSLRHTFAVSRLTQWYAEQKPVLDLIPNLSVYLGHASVADSYWYISATPELLTSAGVDSRTFQIAEGQNEDHQQPRWAIGAGIFRQASHGTSQLESADGQQLSGCLPTPANICSWQGEFSTDFA
jgi:integrase